MSRRASAYVVQRILELHFEAHLPASLIKERLGVSERTIWNYIRAFREGKVERCTTQRSVESGLID